MIRPLPVHPSAADLQDWVDAMRRRIDRVDAAIAQGVEGVAACLVADELEAADAHLNEAGFLLSRQMLRVLAPRPANDNGTIWWDGQ